MDRHYKDYDAKEWLRIAYRNARDFSDDPSTQCGAVLISEDGNQIVYGANHFPKGVKITEERMQRPTKYAFMEHAERDCILNAALRGVSTLGATLYSPWFSCCDCARAIIGAGIKEVIGHQSIFDMTPDRWIESIEIGNKMLDEAGVYRTSIVGKLFKDDEVFGEDPNLKFEVLFDGKLWTP